MTIKIINGNGAIMINDMIYMKTGIVKIYFDKNGSGVEYMCILTQPGSKDVYDISDDIEGVKSTIYNIFGIVVLPTIIKK